MKYDIYHRYTGDVLFSADIACSEDAPEGFKKGMAARWAIANNKSLRHADLRGAALRYASLIGARLSGAALHGANLRDSDLSGADLIDANLTDANLTDARLSDADLRHADLRGSDLRYASLIGARLSGARGIIASTDRVDGYRFVGWVIGGVLRINAGCRSFSILDAREHWNRTRPIGISLGDETRLILDHIESVAKLRGMIK